MLISKKSKVTVYGDHHRANRTTRGVHPPCLRHAEHHTGQRLPPRRRIVPKGGAHRKDLIKEFKPSTRLPHQIPRTGSHSRLAPSTRSTCVFPGGGRPPRKLTVPVKPRPPRPGVCSKPTGTVRLLGKTRLADSQAARAKVGIMLQDGGLPSAIHPIPLLEHISTTYTDRPVEELAERLGIDAFSGTTIRRLSGRSEAALHRRPHRPPGHVLFLDEPLRGPGTILRLRHHS